jgi:hypothetical protein
MYFISFWSEVYYAQVHAFVNMSYHKEYFTGRCVRSHIG